MSRRAGIGNLLQAAVLAWACSWLWHRWTPLALISAAGAVLQLGAFFALLRDRPRWARWASALTLVGVATAMGLFCHAALHLMERFTPVDGGARLNYALTVSDPDFFTETFTLQRSWEWRPEMVVGRYDCAQDQELGGASAQRN